MNEKNTVSYHNTIVKRQTVKVPRLLTNHIYKNADHLLGRDTELVQAHALLAQNCPTVLFNGMGGIGKTSVAIKYVAHYGHKYQHLAWLTVQSGLLETFTRSETLLDALHIKQQVIDFTMGNNRTRVGATFESKLNEKHSISARAFYTSRQLLNRLALAANGYGDLKRNYYGVALGYQLSEHIGTMSHRLKLGLDLENQADTRQRLSYTKVVTNGETVYNPDKVVLNQLEGFKTVGVYLLQELQPTKRLLVSCDLISTLLRTENIAEKDVLSND